MSVLLGSAFTVPDPEQDSPDSRDALAARLDAMIAALQASNRAALAPQVTVEAPEPEVRVVVPPLDVAPIAAAVAAALQRDGKTDRATLAALERIAKRLDTLSGQMQGAYAGSGGTGGPIKLVYGDTNTLVDAAHPLPVTSSGGGGVTQVNDKYTGWETRPEQTAAGTALTFTFTAPVQLVVVTTTGVDGHATVDGATTATATVGQRIVADAPAYLPVPSQSVISVFASSGVVNLSGWRY